MHLQDFVDAFKDNGKMAGKWVSSLFVHLTHVGTSISRLCLQHISAEHCCRLGSV